MLRAVDVGRGDSREAREVGVDDGLPVGHAARVQDRFRTQSEATCRAKLPAARNSEECRPTVSMVFVLAASVLKRQVD